MEEFDELLEFPLNLFPQYLETRLNVIYDLWEFKNVSIEFISPIFGDPSILNPDHTRSLEVVCEG